MDQIHHSRGYRLQLISSADFFLDFGGFALFLVFVFLIHPIPLPSRTKSCRPASAYIQPIYLATYLMICQYKKAKTAYMKSSMKAETQTMNSAKPSSNSI